MLPLASSVFVYLEVATITHDIIYYRKVWTRTFRISCSSNIATSAILPRIETNDGQIHTQNANSQHLLYLSWNKPI